MGGRHNIGLKQTAQRLRVRHETIGHGLAASSASEPRRCLTRRYMDENRDGAA